MLEALKKMVWKILIKSLTKKMGGYLTLFFLRKWALCYCYIRGQYSQDCIESSEFYITHLKFNIAPENWWLEYY